MRFIVIGAVRALPDSIAHPEPMIAALKGLCVPLDLGRFCDYVARHPKFRLPSTAYLPVPLMDIVEALGGRGRIEAMIYWRDVIRPYYIGIPVTCCTINEQAWSMGPP